MSKKQKPQPSKIISSDPATVNRMLEMLPREFNDDVPLRRRRRYHTPTPNNQDHPYQGGSPGLGKKA